MMDEEDYNSSYSEEDYSREDKLLLEDARKLMRRRELSSDEEIHESTYGLLDDEDDGEDEEEDAGLEDTDMGSDIEEDAKVPDDRAWGKRKRSFYSTDFIDQDYEGIYQGEEAEVAELEEEEAKNIQKRLAEQLNEADFCITEAVDVAEATEATAKEEVISSDLTKLTKRQKLDLLKKESPEFFVLVEDFKEKLQEVQKFLPLIKYFKGKIKQTFPALEFLQTKLSIILNYCTNISYYLLLKAKRIPIKNHPVLKSLFRYRQLLGQLEDVDKKVIQPQLDKILKVMESGKEIAINKNLVEKKTVLKVLTKQKEKREREAAMNEEKQEEEAEEEEEEEENEEETELEDEMQEEQKDETMVPVHEKRAITYEMAKNKGLIPKRKKEQRNPRVKHRRKYEKAKIRRRGQVRTPRAEIPVYGGEPTGIKIGLTKSIKMKY